MENNTANWDFLNIEGVEEAIEHAARKVASHYEVDQDDLYQEGLLLVATKRDLQDCFTDPELRDPIGALHYRLERDLVNVATKDVTRRQRNTSYEERVEYVEGGFAPRPANVAIRNDVSSYTRELVESLIPAVWDESFCFGIRVENAPDADMPRGTTNKSTGNTLAAHIADINTGWDKAPLTLEERRVLLLGYGMDWTQKEIAFNLGIPAKTVSRRLYSGVGKIVSCLNGDFALMFELCEEAEAAAA